MRSAPDIRKLLGALHEQTWRDRAACRGLDPSIFHPERGESIERPKQICASCPVQADCLEYSIRANEQHGIWAGIARRDRQRIRNARRHEQMSA